ncbi:hypothetical protein [Thiohalophilus sp.]|uniref:hypothetical protein n=1 Tax=Thiohalophilus sp. TaxID=3028392 RepID=UPI002ACE703F|nr:hypothetical protein [Thiohalophilus sp.]MDZ7805261.1 hypothetical protein [Thiohalophilus sp.]
MKALLIRPQSRSIEPIEIGRFEDIVKLIGYETIAIDEVDASGDRLFFDEECFLRGSEGRFQIDSLIPVSGNGVVMGAEEDGSGLRDVTLSQEALAARTKFL